MNPAKMKVGDLRSELGALGLDTKGYKAALVMRLLKKAREAKTGKPAVATSTEETDEPPTPRRTPVTRTTRRSSSSRLGGTPAKRGTCELTEKEEWQQLNERLKVKEQKRLERKRRLAEEDQKKLKELANDEETSPSEAKNKAKDTSEVEIAEPELNDNRITLSWHDSDLNQNLKLPQLNPVVTLSEGAFFQACGGFSNIKGFSDGQECYKDEETSPSEAKNKAKDTSEVEIAEPELNDNRITLSWLGSGLNQNLKLPQLKPVVTLSEGAFFQACGGFINIKGFSDGQECYKVRVGSVVMTTETAEKVEKETVPSCITIGWGTDDNSRQLGEGEFSWGYESSGRAVHNGEFKEYGQRLNEKDEVGVHLDLTSSPCVIFYTVNGVSQGTAYEFDKSTLNGRPLYPAVCFKVKFGYERYTMLTKTKIVLNRIEIQEVLEEKRRREEELRIQREEAAKREKEKKEREEREEREKRDRERKEKEAQERRERGEEEPQEKESQEKKEEGGQPQENGDEQDTPEANFEAMEADDEPAEKAADEPPEINEEPEAKDCEAKLGDETELAARAEEDRLRARRDTLAAAQRRAQHDYMDMPADRRAEHASVLKTLVADIANATELMFSSCLSAVCAAVEALRARARAVLARQMEETKALIVELKSTLERGEQRALESELTKESSEAATRAAEKRVLGAKLAALAASGEAHNSALSELQTWRQQVAAWRGRLTEIHSYIEDLDVEERRRADVVKAVVAAWHGRLDEVEAEEAALELAENGKGEKEV